MLKLYGLDRSGNTYKARLFMNIHNIEYQQIPIDVNQKQHKSPEFRKLNPRGEFPVLEDNGYIVWDSQAILIYLARQYTDDQWFPCEAKEMAAIAQWLTVANGEIFQTLGRARAIIQYGYPGDLAEAQKKGIRLLQRLNEHLEERNWIATDNVNISDIACYPYIALAEEGDISVSEYPHIHRWFTRIQALPGYIPMNGLYQTTTDTNR